MVLRTCLPGVSNRLKLLKVTFRSFKVLSHEVLILLIQFVQISVSANCRPLPSDNDIVTSTIYSQM